MPNLRSRSDTMTTHSATDSTNRVRITRREWVPVVILLLAAVLLWIPFWQHMSLVALQNPDAQDYAQISRHLARGEGFVTSVMPLSGLEWMRQTDRLDQVWWNVHRFPLPSLIQASLFRMFGASDLTAALYSALFFFATIPLVFLFARRLFSQRVALLAAFLYVFAGGPMQDSVTGLSEPAMVFLFVAALYLVLWRGQDTWALVLAGVLTGLGFLNRSSIVIYGLLMLPLIWKARPGRGWINLFVFGFPAAIVMAPWLWRNWQLTGDPLFSLTSALMVPYMTEVSPHTHGWYVFAYQPAGEFVLAHPAAVLKKWALLVVGLFGEDLTYIGGVPWILPVFVLSLLKKYDRPVEAMRRWLLVLFVAHVTILALLSNIPRYYVLFAPFIVIFAADVLVDVFDLFRARVRTPRFALFLALAILPMVHWLTLVGPPRQPRNYRVRFETRFENTDWLRANTPADALIVSDIPWSVGWYADRHSLMIPPTPAEMARFRDYNLEPNGVYLKAPGSGNDIPPEWTQWRGIQYGGKSLEGYRTVQRFPDGAVYLERARGR